ncbi:MAG: ABC transporter permease, partial [Dysgonamonadaceae bacterium]|nr:ABC transporter permease [Dysgonamonadaceae bacterium]
LRPVGVVDADKGGNISMKNEQVLPFNIFVNREELAEVLETEGKINLILSKKMITSEELNEVWNYSVSGLSFSQKEDFTVITSDRIFLQSEVSDIIIRDNENPNRLFSYLANFITSGPPPAPYSPPIPYSFVTAIDRFQNETLAKDEVIYSDYTANRLNVKVGDVVQIYYFVSHDLKTLETRSVDLRVKSIVPIQQLVNKNLSSDFPGLSGVESCTDWDADLPINFDLITDEDERYWELYNNTPKAIIAYNAIVADWSNAYGNATAIRVSNATPDLSNLRAEMFGIQIIHPREAGIYAALNGVDFSGLFLALGFFIIISAMLLMLIPLSEMLYQRRKEITLYQSLGYHRKRIIGILWRESAPVVFLSSIVGVVAGLIYTTLVMWLLGTVWKGATNTDGFSVYPNISTIIIGFAVGIVLSLLVLRLAIFRNLKDKKGAKTRKREGTKVQKILTMLFSVLSALIIVLNFILIRDVSLFVVGAVILIVTAALWGDYLVYKKGSVMTKNAFRQEKMIWNTLFFNRKQAILSFLTLTMGVFIVFSVGLNRQGFANSSQIRVGTGGFSIWGESSVPIFHNMATEAGHERLSLTALPTDAEILQFLRLSADDASCLNLNKVSTPNVLGVDIDALAASYFQIEQSLHSKTREQVFEAMKTKTDTVYPALVDATVLQWSLGKSVGDTLFYEVGNGQIAAIQIIGTLVNSIFQGNILIDRNHFSEIWSDISGSEVFLIKVQDDEIERTKNLLSRALSEYGVRISTTNERLRQFNIVTDTYLTIFLTLGSLGLLLGIISFVIVVRKNLTMRRKEIDLYRTLGFTDTKIEQSLYRENLFVPLYAIIVGVVCSLVGASISFMNTSIWVWLMALVFTVFFVGCVVVFVRKSVKNSMK